MLLLYQLAMLNALQIIALVFILIMFYFTYLHFRRKEISILEIIILTLVWIAAALITIFPETFGTLSHKFDIVRTFDLAVIGGFIFVIPLVYLSYTRTKRLEKKLEEYIRKEAIKYPVKKSK